ncbi:MAG: hypothetical protein P8080_02005 [Gammaproteobacteria bacterium]
MSESNPIRLFVVHGWIADDDYSRLIEYLETAENFFYRSVSKPDAPVAGGDGVAARRQAIVESLKDAECVVCAAAIWDRYNDWARYTVDRAEEMELPLVAIEYFGPREMDLRLKGHAAEVVSWDSRSIVDAIRRQARHEDTTRFDVIDFDM